jgi:hypothetical protein
VAAALRLTAEQREQVQVIEEETLFRWLRTPGASPRPVNERLLGVLTEEQARRWREMSGEAVKGTLAPFGPPPGPKGPGR